MEPILFFESPRDPYVSDAMVLTCFDARFDLVLRKLLKKLRVELPDVIRVAGGPKALVSGTESELAFVLEQLRLSRRLHRAARVLLVGHSDCGAYGGLSDRFQGDPRQEFEFQEAELTRAAAALRERMRD